MPYTLNRTDGSTLVTLADGVVDNTTDLQLVGRNVAGYGEIQNENFVKLLENFASVTTPPSKPQVGQGTQFTQNTGSGVFQNIAVMNPYLTLNYIIRALK